MSNQEPKQQNYQQQHQSTPPSTKQQSGASQVPPPPTSTNKVDGGYQVDRNEVARRQAAARAYALNTNTTPANTHTNNTTHTNNNNTMNSSVSDASASGGSAAIIRRPAATSSSQPPQKMQMQTQTQHTLHLQAQTPHDVNLNTNFMKNQPNSSNNHMNNTTATKNKAVRKLLPVPTTNNTSSSNNHKSTSEIHSFIKKQHQKQIRHAHQMKFINELKINVDDEDYLKFVQGLWNNDDLDLGSSGMHSDRHYGGNIHSVHSRHDQISNNHSDYAIYGNGKNDQGNGNSVNIQTNNNLPPPSSSIPSINQSNNNTATTSINSNNEQQQQQQQHGIVTNDDDDDEEYQQDDDEDEDDDDDENDDMEDNVKQNHILSPSNTTQSSSTTVSSTTVSSPSTSSKIHGISTTPSTTKTPKSQISTQQNNYNKNNNQQQTQNLINELDDFSIDYEALEEELGSLLEEDMEAAVNSLLYYQESLDKQNHHSSSSQHHHSGGYIESGVMNNSLNSQIVLNSPLRTLPIHQKGTPPMYSTPLIKNSNNNTCSSISNASPAGMSTPLLHNRGTTMSTSSTSDRSPLATGKNIRPSPASSPSKSTITTITSTPATTNTSPSKSGGGIASQQNQHQHHPTPTEEQIHKLQKLMRDHYQILLQQAVLAVRCAHGSKFNNKDLLYSHNNGSNTTATTATAPTTTATSSTTPQKQNQQKGHHHQYQRKRNYDFFFCGETSDDLSMILDGAVTMLQDLDENRKDAMRNLIISSHMRMNASNDYNDRQIMMRRKRRRVDGNDDGNSVGLYESSGVGDNGDSSSNGLGGDDEHSGSDDSDMSSRPRRLTRSVFSRTLQEHEWGGGSCGGNNNGLGVDDDNLPDLHNGTIPKSNDSSTTGSGGIILGNGMSNSNLGLGASTTFGVNGLSRLSETFAAIDNSLNPSGFGGVNIFDEADHGHACEGLLLHARADFDRDLIPGYRDLSNQLTFPAEVLGSPAAAVMKAKEPISMSQEQQTALRKNRGQFTAAEDNLLLRGVNLYGEKEWTLISDRYLPDRSVSSISQRYWRLCLLIYIGQGVAIDEKGSLQTPPAHPGGVQDFDEDLIARVLKPVQKPIEYGLYRWSLEEDVMLLKAVPIMGRMFSEIVKRFIPHRDRGALRKRYQVLERRVKGAMKRDKKSSNEIVRKTVAPLMEAISKKGPLPLPRGHKQPATTQNLRRYMNVKPAMTVGKQVRMPMPTLPTASNAIHHRQPYFTLPSAVPNVSSVPMHAFPAMNASLGIQQVPNYNHPKSLPHPVMIKNTQTERNPPPQPKTPVATTPVAKTPAANTPETPVTMSRSTSSDLTKPLTSGSPSKVDSTSRIGFEKIMNGEYSQMSAVKHFMDESDDKNKDKTNQNTSSQQNQSSRPAPAQYEGASLPNFNLDNSYSGLSLLSAADVGVSRSDKNPKESNKSHRTSIMNSVLGRVKDSRSTPPPAQPPTKPPVLSSPTTDKEMVENKDQQQYQSLDGFSFSNLRLPMDEDSRQTIEKDDGTPPHNNNNPQAPPLPPLTNSYLATPTAFSHFPNAQSSYLFNTMTNNSLIVPPQHEVDAAATLSQMSNSSANFPTDLLSSPVSPDRRLSLPETKPQAAPSSTTTTKIRPSLFDNVKGRTKNK